MQRHLSATVFAAIIALTSATALQAKPVVQLKLQGALVEHDAKGNEKLTPMDSAALRPGEVIRYDILATNSGTDPATKFVPAARVPAGTVYENGSASVAGVSRVEFSVDGGKTWAVKPVISVKTAQGMVEKTAPTSAFTMLRWVSDKDLAPNQTVTYTYEVRVK